MKIAFRADGGSKIGMGHIMRMLVLSKELAKTNEVLYICRIDNPLTDKYKAGIKKIKSEGFNIEYIKEESVIEDLKKITADCLITDSYDVNESYFDETKRQFRLTGYVDDMSLYNFNVDFIINQNINAEELNYKVNKDTKLFLGTRYVMIREEFRNAPEKIVNKEISEILITLGGADPNNVTEKILDCVKKLDYKFHVVIGASFSYLEGINKVEKENKNIKLYFNANIFKLMQKCDVAISSCGSTLYELSACGVPTFGIVVADNQRDVAIDMDKKGLIINLGDYKRINFNTLLTAINDISYDQRINMVNKQRHFVDKNGAESLSFKLNTIFQDGEGKS